MDASTFIEFNELFKTMVSASLEIRPNIDELLQRYELILEKSGIKGTMYFSNNSLHKYDKNLKGFLKSLNKTLKKYKGTGKYDKSIFSKFSIHNKNGRKTLR